MGAKTFMYKIIYFVFIFLILSSCNSNKKRKIQQAESKPNTVESNKKAAYSLPFQSLVHKPMRLAQINSLVQSFKKLLTLVLIIKLFIVMVKQTLSWVVLYITGRPKLRCRYSLVLKMENYRQSILLSPQTWKNSIP